MRIKFNAELGDDEVKAIAVHLGKAWVGDEDIRGFLNQGVQDAIEHVMTEYKAVLNDPKEEPTPETGIIRPSASDGLKRFP
jgi:hypothetical protein